MSNIKVKEADVIEIGNIKKEMMEKRPLPIGKKQFEEWSDRIIAGAEVEASPRSLKFSLASMILHNLSATESFKEDAYFIHCLRKAASNQTAHYIMEVIKDEQIAEKKQAEETAKKHLTVVSDGVLEDKDV